jgi:hypothetical protein
VAEELYSFENFVYLVAEDINRGWRRCKEGATVTEDDWNDD